MELNLGSLEGITGNDMRRNWPEVWNPKEARSVFSQHAKKGGH
ncbi:MAG: hypothetical protein CM1200mP15_07840 [Dehalococcoidia bacterium]|nr:MAG: hypothetical protein CM1200mP15_07840 [Dehalococcoidia bacterium]